MPTFELDGQKIECSPGKTIIEAAYENGLTIPHFCWHPELSVAGNCRMCLVEVGMPRKDREGNLEKDENGNPVIGFFPKLQIACATPVSDGMVVRSKSEKAVEAQEAVMEFLLINHPLDCPICDEAGECKLQEYAFNHSKGHSRFVEEKNHKPKHQVWGPNVIFDAERCISCSRCIRFAQEVAKQDVLTFVQRGDHVTIELFDGTVFDNPYSMNVIELCPVGALTSSDFRFKSRVWEMSFNPSISFADGSGSNTFIGVKNNEILRIQPRTNMYVNEYWLTDDARLNHHNFVNDNRVTDPMIKVDGVQVKVSWDEAYAKTAVKLKQYGNSAAILASSYMTNEDAFAVKKFAGDTGAKLLGYLPHKDENSTDDLLMVADKTPNSNGLDAIGIGQIGMDTLRLQIESGQIKMLYVIEEKFKDYEELIPVLDKLECLVVNNYNKDSLTNRADIVLATSTYAEIEGTYTNYKNRVQYLEPALITKENLRVMGMKISRWDAFGAQNDRWTRHELRSCRQTWRILQGVVKELDSDWGYKKSEDVFNELGSSVESFNGMDYSLLEEYQGIELGKSDEPDPKIQNYVSHSMKPQH